MAKGFQSTCPVRGTTLGAGFQTNGADISIHVPRTGHDTARRRGNDFVPAFQSTCPGRGPTARTATQ